MDRFESSVDIHAPAALCYERWHQFENFPHFMEHVKQVTKIDNTHWHWVINSPIGKTVSWNAEIDADERNRVIAWHTTGDSDLSMQGVVRFDEMAPNHTRLSCLIQYTPSENGLGSFVGAIANLVTHPQKMVETDLENFKHVIEGTHIPASKVHQGKTLVPDPEFVTSDDTPSLGDEGNQELHTREQDTTAKTLEKSNAAAATILPTRVSGRGGVTEKHWGSASYNESFETLEANNSSETEYYSFDDEEPSYLSSEGALYSEDLLDMQASDNTVDENDIFTNSMDVDEEDLENFTEDLDEDIDSALPSSAEVKNME